jgi:predicted metal-dependent RNase
MSQVNYNEMSDQELKQYFLQNRQDQAALEAYLDRLNQRPQNIIASPGDVDFNEKIQAAIRQKLQVLENS